MGVKRPGREADHSPPSSAEVKECVELYLRSPNTPSWRGAEFSTRTTLPLIFLIYSVLTGFMVSLIISQTTVPRVGSFGGFSSPYSVC
jgi:hypothetical protein